MTKSSQQLNSVHRFNIVHRLREGRVNLATAPAPQASSDDSNVEQKKKKSRRRKTSHLKLVPETRELREQIRARCREVAARLDKSVPLTKDDMEQVARKLLEEIGHGESFLGWTMVMLSTAFWEDQVAHVPPERRLFLLPHCLKHAEGCPADYDEFGLDCKTCGACSIADFRTVAEEMGYRVLVAEGSPIVLKIIVSGYVDAIVGVACLNVLEKAIDKILLAGIPCMAVPLLSSDCRNTSVDEEWVMEMINNRSEEKGETTRSYLHLMRAAEGMFAEAELERLAPRLRKGPRLTQTDGLSAIDPIAATETIAYDFLAKGGKYSRPFITLAVYDALTGGQATEAGGTEHLAKPELDAVKRAAMSIETFHKASLVHDDIEDDDSFRYGEATMHRQFGIPTAINVGDYLIGLGYRLVSRETGDLGAETASEILDCLAQGHLKLAEGQGAELAWRDSKNLALEPLDALRIYALKTAPAFEAAFFTGARLAGSLDSYREPLKLFARNLGVAFQILNDLKDWEGDDNNKMEAGADTLQGRPTLLWALALDAHGEEQKAELHRLASDTETPAPERLARVRQLYERADVFEKAHRLVDKHQDRAEKIADEIQPDELRRLLYYLIDSVLERGTKPTAPTAIQEITDLTQAAS
ncbi:MAG: polyprenyl synthetase [Planctomycetaceae bacterium]|nr:polyprenyl synthetase [Planctomycetaceae bacterium]